jgi:hypothetical protein
VLRHLRLSKVRPYEAKIGETDRVVNEGAEALAKTIEATGDITATLRTAIEIAASKPPGRASHLSARWARSTCATTPTPTRT